ncbi:hypothetical protein RND71_009734 [Anisodus tanguticus]|uniref:Uncharacterized protein n=1 Tax=Anisodus tanguticus TaxID=243964 RepID=A0AAE1SGC2_9SOLA|nr:hypothetical protein RND71_009734 [Anisodus tanguticus]
MVAATLVLLCTKPLESSVFGQLPWLLTVPSIAIIGREITMSAVREWAASQGGKLSEAVSVNNLVKWKTATQMIALTILLLTRDSSLSGVGTLVGSGVILLYISAWLAMMRGMNLSRGASAPSLEREERYAACFQLLKGSFLPSLPTSQYGPLCLRYV